jgi:hypothetical protein
VSTRPISTSIAVSTCEVCGRTLLRGEHAEVYVGGGGRRSVCELCTARALHSGWVREGTVPSFTDTEARVDRRRSLLGRLRTRRDAASNHSAGSADADGAPASAPAWPDSATRKAIARSGTGVREPRHVRAVPTSTEHKIASAIALFNASEHPRTVAGITRSLGLPEAAVLPAPTLTAVVYVVVSWELCWYRYEVDLSDEQPTVRPVGQGYELEELAPPERRPNVTVDSDGMLTLG